MDGAQVDHNAQATVLEARLGPGVTVLCDVLVNPSLVKIIPAGSLVRHRDVAFDPELWSVRLTAYQPPTQETWSATIAGFGDETARALREAHRDRGSGLRRADGTRQHFLVSLGKTAEAALDELEAELRRAFAAETRRVRERRG